MLILGLLLLAAAAVAIGIAIGQNLHTNVAVHAVGQQWTVHLYWLVVLGAVAVVVALVGLAAIRRGTQKVRRSRREHAQLLDARERLAALAGEEEPAAHPDGLTAETTSRHRVGADGERAEAEAWPAHSAARFTGR